MKGKIAALAVVLFATPTVAMYEGVIPGTYADPVGIPTACVGETDREITSMGRAFSRDECMAVLGASLYAYAQRLDKCIHRPLERHEAAALLSWAYNVGTGAACDSTLVRKLNAGQPFCGELDRWVYAGGIKLRGLVRRRAAEKAICLGNLPVPSH